MIKILLFTFLLRDWLISTRFQLTQMSCGSAQEEVKRFRQLSFGAYDGGCLKSLQLTLSRVYGQITIFGEYCSLLTFYVPSACMPESVRLISGIWIMCVVHIKSDCRICRACPLSDPSGRRGGGPRRKVVWVPGPGASRAGTVSFAGAYGPRYGPAQCTGRKI